MPDNHRFASLNGACRKWLNPDEYELDEDLEPDAEPHLEEGPSALSDHDGWGPIRPRREPLTRRLGDLLSS